MNWLRRDAVEIVYKLCVVARPDRVTDENDVLLRHLRRFVQRAHSLNTSLGTFPINPYPVSVGEHKL